ncbi:hypothetical protein ILUMI_03185 [Ignelater luminosus]|uniref:DNA-directed RNA polymerase I subunit RPA49 n=1 Tax=Ignelater luminosus TaxID=2038154 RepID=A0A8K0GKQ1_IGNLU|nr:hypothetical protein ILUMI_03185 [Ignelater luminosus]
MDDDTCLISDVKFDDTSIRPVILKFENGTPKADLPCRLYKDNRDRFLVAAATEKLLYSGPVNHDELYNNFIAVHNKKKNKIRLLAVDYATLSPLLQRPKEAEDISFHDSRELTAAALNKQFGSKRAKRQTEQRERMQLDIENVREQLEQTVADIEIDVAAPSIDENDSTYKPPINREATNIANVYNVDEIVSSTILESMSEEVSRILESEEEDLGTTSFITQEIKKLQKSTLDQKEKLCQLLLYVDSLIKFTIATAKTVTSKKFQSCPYSEAVSKDILMKFTVPSKLGRLRPNIMKDKCLCYILVLTMIACGYKISLDILAKELKMSLKKLQDVARILAFSVSKEIATLKLPLPAPVVSVGRGRRGKKKN